MVRMSQDAKDTTILAQALGQVIGTTDQSLLLEVAAILSKVINGELNEDEAKNILYDNQFYTQVIERLSGKTFKTSEALVSFGKENQNGDINIRDVVGGHSINISFNINTSTTTHKDETGISEEKRREKSNRTQENKNKPLPEQGVFQDELFTELLLKTPRNPKRTVSRETRFAIAKSQIHSEAITTGRRLALTWFIISVLFACPFSNNLVGLAGFSLIVFVFFALCLIIGVVTSFVHTYLTHTVLAYTTDRIWTAVGFGFAGLIIGGMVLSSAQATGTEPTFLSLIVILIASATLGSIIGPNFPNIADGFLELARQSSAETLEKLSPITTQEWEEAEEIALEKFRKRQNVYNNWKDHTTEGIRFWRDEVSQTETMIVVVLGPLKTVEARYRLVFNTKGDVISITKSRYYYIDAYD